VNGGVFLCVFFFAGEEGRIFGFLYFGLVMLCIVTSGLPFSGIWPKSIVL
jgi:hypothetical protein